MIGANAAEGESAAPLLFLGLDEEEGAALRGVFEPDRPIVTVQSAEEARAAVQGGAVSAIVYNPSLPGCDECLDELDRDHRLPLFAVAAAHDDDLQMHALERGADDVILTPVKPQLARARMRNALGNRRHRFDPLTGLYREDAFEREAAARIAAQPAGTYLLACCDVDNFKAVNSQYGRTTGDFVLHQIGTIITDYASSYDGIACRVSADNFEMLLPADTPALLPDLVASLENVFKGKNIHLKLQLSIGRYIIDDKGISLSEMTNNALLAKRTVKGRYNVSVAYFDDEMRRASIEEQRIIGHMDYALAEGQFEVWLQPQYNHETGAMTGAEALVRWRNPEQDAMIPPNAFVPVFERNGFIYELDKYVWEQVCKLLRLWLDEGKKPLPISVNVSRIDVLQDDFYERITGLVEAYGIPTELLRLEITESAFSFDTALIISMVKRLQERGFTIEIDDFGSGYSSFNVLKDVPADVLKLDMMFLSGEDRTGRSGNIIESVVRMAKWIGVQIIAEGVETKEQADFLSSIGCSIVQGYLYDRPLPLAAFEEKFDACEKASDANTFETIDVLDSSTFWSPESLESLIFNSYVGGACVVEFTEGGCEVIRANDMFRETLNTPLTLGELLKIDPLTCLSDQDAARLRADVLQAAREGRELTGELAFTLAKTDPAHQEHLRYRGRTIAQGRFRNEVYFLVENITEQKRALKKLEDLNESMERLMNDTPGGFGRAAIAPDGSFGPTFTNDRFCQLLGMTREEVVEAFDSPTYELVHPDDLSELRELLQNLPNEDEVLSARIRLKHKERGYVPLQASFRTIIDSDGVRHVNSYYTDITAAAERDERRKELLDNLPCGAAIYRIADGTISVLHVNKQFQNLVARSESQIYAQNALEAVHPDDRGRVMDAIRDGADDERMVCDYRVLHGNGGYLAMHVVGKTEPQDDGSSLIYATCTPITDDELSVGTAHADQLKAERLAEDINGQLLFLNGISRFLLVSKNPDEAIGRALEKIREHFDGKRSYVFEFDHDRHESSNTYEVCAPGVVPEQANLQDIPFWRQSFIMDEFHHGRTVCIEDVSALSDDAKEERDILMRQGIHSVFLVPLWSDGMLIGYTGVDDPRRNMRHISQLAALGDYIAAMLIRRDHVARMEQDNDLMQRLMNDTPGGFVRLKMLPGGNAVPAFINDGFCQIMGMTHDEAMELYTADAYAGVHPDDIPELMKAAARAMEESAMFSARARFWHKERGYAPFQAFYRTTDEPDGSQYMNAYYVDMTSEAELEERRKELLDNLPCGAIIFEIDADGTLNTSHINKRYTELVQREGGQLRTRDAIQAIHPDDREHMMRAIGEAIEHERDMECDIRTLKGDGGYRAFHLVGRTVARDAQKTVIYTTYMPISEETRSLSAALADQRRAEQVAQETNEQLRLLSDVSRYLLTGDDPDEAIRSALGETAAYFDGDRAYLFELDDARRLSSNTYEFCAPGIVSEQELLQSVPFEMQSHTLSLLRHGANLYLDDTSTVPDFGICDRGVRSLVLMPLRSGGKLSGFMGVDNPRRNVACIDHLGGLGDSVAAILQRRDSEEQILRDNRVMRDLMNDMPGGFVQQRVSPDGRTVPIFINEEFCRMSGMSHDECFAYYGSDGFTGVHPDDNEMAKRELEKLIATRETITLRLRLFRGDGSYVPMQVFYRVTDDRDGNLLLSGYYTDLTEQLAVEERAMAEHDELTGLFNRTKLAHMKTDAYRDLGSCGVLFFDVNHLKTVNDSEGHDQGDVLLRLVADGIASITDERVHGYRYGGDEFLVVACDGAERELAELTARWTARMRELADERQVEATAAVGCAWSEAPFTLNDLIRRADRAMYADKQRVKRDEG
ncbi:EAL domain-containing protein [Eggerthella guodeyinii]|nr:EAL domain-containing protein [Eggerthella guodeyinii]